MTFRSCSGCRRHVRASETHCPFCKTATGGPFRSVALGTVLVASALMASGCQILAGPAYGLPPGLPAASVPVDVVPPDCQNTAPRTHAVGTSAQGDYAGKPLPEGWAAVGSNNSEVTLRISKLADAAKYDPNGPYSTSWTDFKCLYSAAVAVWRNYSGRSD